VFFYIGVNMATHITVYATYYSTNILVYNTIILDVSFLGGFTHFTIVPVRYWIKSPVVEPSRQNNPVMTSKG
jgi:hypothetical protein